MSQDKFCRLATTCPKTTESECCDECEDQCSQACFELEKIEEYELQCIGVSVCGGGCDCCPANRRPEVE